MTGPAFEPPTVICNDEHRFLVAEAFRHAGLSPAHIILEPVARNTAPALAAAAIVLLRTHPDAIMLAAPSDHVIGCARSFADCVEQSYPLAADNHLVTFGVHPSRPDTGYGYIHRGEPVEPVGWRVDAFTEKPDAATAERLVSEGDSFWNSGIFLFSAQAYLSELGKFHPDMIANMEKAVASATPDLDFLRLQAEAFGAAENISIDYAVMEKTTRAVVVPLASSWSDVGSWDSFSELGEADADGNVISGDGLLVDTRNTFVHSEKHLVAALGLDDMVVVATDDSILVTPRERSQDVRKIVQHLETSGRAEHISHSRVNRPWGHYQNLEAAARSLVKRIVVRPGAKLSLQYHHHRAEHWIVVSGQARVTIGDETFELSPDQSTYIPKGVQHRLENPGEEPLHLIEVQSGDYIGEDDIVRLEDIYGR